MNRFVGVLVIGLAVAASGYLAGCAQQAKSSSEAIKTAQAMETPEEQGKYLVSQVKGFLRSKDYKEAISTAQHILGNIQIEASTEAAQKIVADAKDQIAKDAQNAAADAKKKLGL